MCVDMANEGFKEDFKNEMYHASYTAWQINETIKALFDGKSNKGTTFKDYTKMLGIDGKPNKEQSKIDLEIEKRKALAIANEIVQLDRKGAHS